MSIKTLRRFGALAALLATVTHAVADDRSDYNRRAAARDLELFHSLDRNADGVVTRIEARGDINFLPRFNEMEVDLDGVVTRAELHRYLDQVYGVRPNRPESGKGATGQPGAQRGS